MRTARTAPGFAVGLSARPVVIAMLHAPPLPGSARSRLPLAALADRVVADARAAVAGGADALLLENYGDAPFVADQVGPHVVAAMTLLAASVRAAVQVPLGLNVLRNDARAALAVAHAAGGSFVRVNVLAGLVATDQGLLTGEAERVLAYRNRLGAARTLSILADVDVKHGRPLWGTTIGDRAQDLATRAGADGLIVTGAATGRAPLGADLEAVRAACPRVPLLVGSGLNADSARELLPLADGAIVGTALKRGGVIDGPIDPARVAAVVRAARAAFGRRRGAPC
jgi:membrane complex biogenesis BtpA family protein